MYRAGQYQPEVMFPISRDPHKGETSSMQRLKSWSNTFPISRDPHKGGTADYYDWEIYGDQ